MTNPDKVDLVIHGGILVSPDAEVLSAKHKLASEKAYVDYGLYAVLGEESLEHIPQLVEAGIIGFKCYMGNTFGRIPSPSTGAMLELFERSEERRVGKEC